MQARASPLTQTNTVTASEVYRSRLTDILV